VVSPIAFPNYVGWDQLCVRIDGDEYPGIAKFFGIAVFDMALLRFRELTLFNEPARIMPD
jgi:hypothetical protein